MAVRLMLVYLPGSIPLNVFVLVINIVPENLGIRDDLFQEFSICQYGLVGLRELVPVS